MSLAPYIKLIALTSFGKLAFHLAFDKLASIPSAQLPIFI
jgi:hypothetical protein